MIDVREHIGLVHAIVRRRYTWALGPRVELDDLVQAGCLGLLRAARDYDPERGKFSTHATWWITHCVRRHIHDRGRLVRVPVWRTERKHGPVPNESVRSLDAPVGGDGSSTLHDLLGSEDPEHASLMRRDAERLLSLIRDPMRRAIVRAHFLGDRTLDAISESYGLSRGRIHQLKQEGLAQIRKGLR